jgi:hypothetical protein
MTEKISLNLTLEELEIIDKYVELNDDTRQLFDKIREAYPKSPEEKAYKRWYGNYPPTTPSVSNYEDNRWPSVSNFEYNRWKSFQIGYKAAKEDLEPKPEGSLKFQLGKSLEDILYDWWSDVFVNHSDLDTETSISDLVDRIELFLPKSQSAEGSQSFDSELLVEGWNNCISVIKGKLRCSITERKLR